MATNVQWFEKEELDARAKRAMLPARTVLDIGAGIRPQQLVDTFYKQRHFCVEPHGEYAAILDGLGYVVIPETAQRFLPKVLSRQYDSVFLLDVIEHLPMGAGREVLGHCIRVAKKQVVVFTPLGFQAQDYKAGEKDGWGLNGAVWQRHLSGWEPRDFPEPWKVLACREYHVVNGRSEKQTPPHGAFWAILDLE